MAEKKIDRYIRNIPKVYKPGINPVITALLKSWAESDDDIVTQLKNTKSQLFVRTAEGQYLNRLASGLGVSRPNELGLLDSEFQELVPNLSLKAKQIRKIFYDTMDVFWGPLFSRANVTSVNFAPYNISPGDVFRVSIDGAPDVEAKALPGDIANPGAATAEEIANILSRLEKLTVSIITDQLTGQERLNIRTNTPGARGSIEVKSSTMVGGGKLDFTLKKFRITDLGQRTVLYQLRPRELIIELPAIVPALRRTLRGSHHFHTDATLEPPVPPANGVWAGSFLFAPTGVSYTVTRQSCVLQQTVTEGSVVPTLTVSGADDIPNEPGVLIFDWGRKGEEQPVRYIGRPNANTILLDPGHVFEEDHSIGANINVLLPDLKPAIPRVSGDDLAIYMTSPAGARVLVQNILKTLAAAGVIINFVVLLPEYQYLCENPYESAL